MTSLLQTIRIIRSYLRRYGLKKAYQTCSDLWLLYKSPLFDVQYYVEHNPNTPSSPFGALVHYYFNGGAEGRSAGPRFNSAEYLVRHPDAVAMKMNPLVHHVRYGDQKEFVVGETSEQEQTAEKQVKTKPSQPVKRQPFYEDCQDYQRYSTAPQIALIIPTYNTPQQMLRSLQG